MRLKTVVAGLLAGGVLVAGLAGAEPIVIDGKGEILRDGSVGVSRSLAIQDAERKALEQQGVRIESYDSGGFSSLQADTGGRSGRTTLLQEERQGDVYRINGLLPSPMVFCVRCNHLS